MNLNFNIMAIELLEKHEYEQAWFMFKQALYESRTIQSLNNMAWFYMHEGEFMVDGRCQLRYDLAIELLEECLSLMPDSYYPYQLLGEAYSRTNRWSEAIGMFKTSISKQFTAQACHNIGVAEYQQGQYEAAAEYFRQTEAMFEGSASGYVQCMIKLERIDEAEKVLESLSISKARRLSDIDMAKLYAALNRYEEAVFYYNKGWNVEWKKSDWVNGYVYALYKTDNHTRRRAVLKEAAAHCDMQMIEAITDLDEEWTLEQRKLYIAERQSEKENYQTLLKRIVSGYVPSLSLEPALESGCYLIGCQCREAKQLYVEAIGPAAAR